MVRNNTKKQDPVWHVPLGLTGKTTSELWFLHNTMYKKCTVIVVSNVKTITRIS
jgi:hypothetical protein